MNVFPSHFWALILGGSSGFGLASAKKLASHGMNIFIIHRDRKGAMATINEEFEKIKAHGIQFYALNLDALSENGRTLTLNKMKEILGNGKVRLLLHSIALGNLKPIAPIQEDEPKEFQTNDNDILNIFKKTEFRQKFINEEDLSQTIYAMGTSLLSWVQDIYRNDLFYKDSRVIGLTSEGNQIAWRGYAAVSAAKMALESISRSIAVEFAPYGIRSNIIQPGVTPSAALKRIPGHEKMQSMAKLRNPFKRTTTAEDVANFIYLMCTDEASWVNGSLIRVDGGENISTL